MYRGNQGLIARAFVVALGLESKPPKCEGLDGEGEPLLAACDRQMIPL